MIVFFAPYFILISGCEKKKIEDFKSFPETQSIQDDPDESVGRSIELLDHDSTFEGPSVARLRQATFPSRSARRVWTNPATSNRCARARNRDFP